MGEDIVTVEEVGIIRGVGRGAILVLGLGPKSGVAMVG